MEQDAPRITPGEAPAQDLSSKGLTHLCRNGTLFQAERCDLKGGLKITLDPQADMQDLVQDAIEFGAFHGMQIWPRLPSFTGYGRLQMNMIGTSAVGEPTRED
jgi:hypothetical protein